MKFEVTPEGEMDYRHVVWLLYDNAEQLNRHMKRLIDREGFYSAGPETDEMDGKKIYGFEKVITEAEFKRMAILGKRVVDASKVGFMSVYEQRTAW